MGNLLRRLTLLAIFAGSVIFGRVYTPQIHAQSTKPTAGPLPSFEVASIKLSKPDAPMRGKDLLTPYDGPAPKGEVFTANAPLIYYIMFAYKILDISQLPSLNAHLPKWAQEEKIDIEARSEGKPTRDQLRLMMRSLLEDRLKLAIHTETRELPVYALVVDKPGKLGTQLQPHPEGVPCSDKPDPALPVAPGSTPPPYCGIDAWWVNGLLHMRMTDVSMEQVASFLGGSAGFIGGREPRPIIDQTELSGKFDVNIEFVHDTGGADIESDASGPTFTGALKNQVGLRLVKETGPARVYVIDHIERPSEN